MPCGPPGVPDMSVKKLGVLGAGMMGAGIAYVSATAGIEVVLIDRDQESADKGRATIAELLGDSVKKKRLTQDAADAVLGRVTRDAGLRRARRLQISMVEAVFEDPGAKSQAVTAHGRGACSGPRPRSSPATPPRCRSAISPRPRGGRQERFIGIHFFSPVHKMMLVEIIQAARKPAMRRSPRRWTSFGSSGRRRSS